MTAEFSPFEIINGDVSRGMVLLCDHARATLPEQYGTLGLNGAEFQRHIAYDIGAEALTLGLANQLNIPAVYSCFSRLLIDPNRGMDDPTLVMRLSDGTIIPGNHPISRDEIISRIELFYTPYHNAVVNMIDQCLDAGRPPIIFSVHSFTPVWKDIPRQWEAAILWDADPRLPQFLIDRLREDRTLSIGDNEPYDGALKNDTMYKHATQRGLAQALLEVRQDLIADDVGVRDWVNRLAPLLDKAMNRSDMNEIRYYGSRTDGTYRHGQWTKESGNE